MSANNTQAAVRYLRQHRMEKQFWKFPIKLPLPTGGSYVVTGWAQAYEIFEARNAVQVVLQDYELATVRVDRELFPVAFNSRICIYTLGYVFLMRYFQCPMQFEYRNKLSPILHPEHYCKK